MESRLDGFWKIWYWEVALKCVSVFQFRLKSDSQRWHYQNAFLRIYHTKSRELSKYKYLSERKFFWGRIVDKYETHISVLYNFPISCIDFEIMKQNGLYRMLFTNNNRANTPELLRCANISEVAWSGCHVHMKVTKNYSTFSTSFVLSEPRS